MSSIRACKRLFPFLMETLEGDIPAKKLRMVQAWIAIHEDELIADWSLAVSGQPVFPIDPLR